MHQNSFSTGTPPQIPLGELTLPPLDVFGTYGTLILRPLPNNILGYSSAYYGISDELMRRLQSVQNAAAMLITGTRR